MALTATSKNQLNNLLALLNDPMVTLHVGSASERLLVPANSVHVKAVLARNPNGSINATETTALATLLADIAAN